MSPSVAVTKKQVELKIRKDYKELEMSYRTLGRIFEILVKREKLVQEGYGQYWLPKYMEKSLVCQRKARELAEKEVECLKKQKEELDRNKKIELLENWQVENEAIIELAKPYLDNLRYCESDEDWELLTKWFMKMQENKHYHEEAEAWEQTQKERAEIIEEEEQKTTQK
jgi:hypothetical protein